MLPIPWYAVLFISIPQAFFATKLGFKLYNLEISIRDCLLISTIVSWGIYFILIFIPIPFINTVFAFLATSLLLYIFDRINLLYIAIAFLTGLIITGIAEGICLTSFVLITGYPPVHIRIYPWVNILVFLPQLTMLVLLYMLTVKKHIVIFNLADRKPYAC